ncbi:hypothetical protein OG500_02665 [Kitasatospora sp. NBC_01250]|uniref:hypothetical protein n=1 Tax=Kitasatospora sp. NBC_01250 TaxID=2903571 RepID=UPI002E32114D|nr:hypothetical protein [Kitasatospora sp. NBC_01250]
MTRRGGGARAGKAARAGGAAGPGHDRTKSRATASRSPRPGSRPPQPGRPRAERSRPGTAAFRFLVGLMMIGVGVQGGLAAADTIGYAARAAGTPGLLTVTFCLDHTTTSSRGSRSHTTTCDGVFRSDDGRTTGTASFEHSRRPPGSTIPVQYHGGDVSSVGVVPVAGRLCGLAAALLAVLGGAAVLLSGTTAASPRLGQRLDRAWWVRRVRRVATVAALGLAAVLVLSGVAALAASAVGGS